jgi:hypothetical protein
MKIAALILSLFASTASAQTIVNIEPSLPCAHEPSPIIYFCQLANDGNDLITLGLAEYPALRVPPYTPFWTQYLLEINGKQYTSTPWVWNTHVFNGVLTAADGSQVQATIDMYYHSSGGGRGGSSWSITVTGGQLTIY